METGCWSTSSPTRYSVTLCFFFQAEDGIRDADVTGVQTCALPISLPLRNEKNCSEGRNNKADLGNCALVQRPDRPRVPDVTAAVECRISVEDLAPDARKRNFDPVIAVNLGSEVHHNQTPLLRLASLAQPREDAALGIMHDEPFEPGILTIELV